MRLLYLEGDRCSLKYLLGAFAAARIEVEQPDALPADLARFDAALLSDYAAGRLDAERLARAVEGGLGLVMVGGWLSFGRGGYARSPLARALPVEMEDGDDRRALVRGAHPKKLRDHPALADLDWENAPVLCGANRVRAKPGAEVVLELAGQPLLVVGEHGRARVAAYAGDLAPHWSGGLTDWGSGTVPGPEGEEMGTDYVAFVARLLSWTARASPSRTTRSSETA